LPKSKCKNYIIIKNTIVAKILIAKVIGRDKIVNSWDFNKMSIVGLISYIVILPANVFYLVIRVMILFDYRGIDNNRMSLLSDIGYCILGILFALNILIVAINIWDCGKR